MRGGIFDNGYSVGKTDLLDFIASANRPVAEKLELDGLPDTFQYPEGLAFFQSLEGSLSNGTKLLPCRCSGIGSPVSSHSVG